jgi:hypothetical protein
MYYIIRTCNTYTICFFLLFSIEFSNCSDSVVLLEIWWLFYLLKSEKLSIISTRIVIKKFNQNVECMFSKIKKIWWFNLKYDKGSQIHKSEFNPLQYVLTIWKVCSENLWWYKNIISTLRQKAKCFPCSRKSKVRGPKICQSIASCPLL